MNLLKTLFILSLISLCSCVDTKTVKNYSINEDITINENEGLIVVEIDSNDHRTRSLIYQNEWGSGTNNPFGAALISLEGTVGDDRFRIFKVSPIEGGLKLQFFLTSDGATYYAKEQEYKFDFMPGEITYIGHIRISWDFVNQTINTYVTDKEKEILEEIEIRYPSLLRKYKFNNMVDASIKSLEDR